MKKGMNRDRILNGNLLWTIIVLSVPVIINSFLQTMYNLTDTYWLGKLGTEELAAINLVTPVQNLVINFGSGITVAGSVLISQYVGAKKDEDARSMANHIFVCAMSFAIVCAALIALATPGIVSWLGAEGETYTYSKIYMQIAILDMPFLYLVNMYVSINQAQGDTVRPMLMNVLGISLNMLFDPILMVVLDMGVAGAALATVFAKAVPAVIALVVLHNRKRLLYLQLSKLKWNKAMLKSIITVGLPSAIGGSTTQLGFLLMSKSVFNYGTQAMAAYGIGNKVNGLISLPSNGIGSAVSIIVGQNVGANQWERARKGYVLSMEISVIFLLAGGLILSRMPISTAIVTIFSDDPTVIAMAADFLSIMAFWCFSNGIYNSTIGLFRGSGHTTINMIVDISRLWLFRFATLFICEQLLHMGIRSVWYSVVVSNGLAAAVMYILYRAGLWKRAITKGEGDKNGKMDRYVSKG